MKPFLTFAFAISLATFARAQSLETVGGGSIATPAIGTPTQPAYGLGGGGFALVKNWNFGTNGTIKNISDLNIEFQYHDQFNTFHNPNYGASIVAPDSANALAGQPIEGPATAGLPVREFFDDSMRTYLVPLNGATTLTPSALNVGSGSFQAIWTLPNGGSLLDHDIIWETRVRYVTPPYFYFGIWAAGNSWNHGAEMDVIESFGYDNGMYFGKPNTNYDGHAWHSNTVGGVDVSGYGNWPVTAANYGITDFDATKYHIWTWYYKKDNSYYVYLDGIEVQSGTINWTVGGTAGGTPINMSFIFDGTWGSPTVWNVNHSLPASALAGKYYEWNYSRVYLR